ncbi:MAG: methionyl-tRNA formyltransferase [Lachnospiraceae bacterium]|nr:methionyl-tRNA formyltransferase [Lachnospiraceae bacterium]
MHVIFMGTPDFAARILEKLAEENTDIALVVTQPDRVKGRGKSVAMSDVKETALKYSIPVFQPERIREPEAVQKIREIKPDIIVVAAFGQILPKELLEIPEYGCINMHASLLPRFRGASPIQQAIIEGDKVTGVTVMQMNEGLDTGDILFQEKIDIADDETGGSLFEKLSNLGAEAAVRALREAEAGRLVATPQSEEGASYAGLIKKEYGRLDFTGCTAARCERLVRALNPWPSAFSSVNGKLIKIWKSRVGREGRFSAPGTVTRLGASDFAIQCSDAELVISEVQLEGKKRMSVHDFLLGFRLKEGDVFI